MGYFPVAHRLRRQLLKTAPGSFVNRPQAGPKGEPHDYRDAGARTIHDYMDVGGRVTPGAVTEETESRDVANKRSQ